MPRHIKQGTHNPYFWRTFHVQYLSSLSSNQLLISAAPWLPCVLPNADYLENTHWCPKEEVGWETWRVGTVNKTEIESAVLTWTHCKKTSNKRIDLLWWTFILWRNLGAQDNRNLSSDFAVSNLPENKKKESFWITVHDRKHIWCFHMRTLPLFSLPTPASQWAWWWSKNRGNPFPQVWS